MKFLLGVVVGIAIGRTRPAWLGKSLPISTRTKVSTAIYKIADAFDGQQEDIAR